MTREAWLIKEHARCIHKARLFRETRPERAAMWLKEAARIRRVLARIKELED